MTYLILILATLVLLAGFLALTRYEAKRGARFFVPLRTRLDQGIEHIEFILAHVDVGAFLRDEIRGFARRFAHDSVHFSLQVVRAIERFLTGLVRHSRMRQAVDIPPRESARTFVKTLSDFKVHLKTVRPDPPHLQ